MKEIIKIYSGVTFAIFIGACSGQYERKATNLSPKTRQTITAKNFFNMNSTDQQEVLNHFQEKCDEPAILNGAANNSYLSSNNQTSEYCFKMCKIKIVEPPPGGATNETKVSTNQVVVDSNYLTTYLEIENRDGSENLFGECNTLPTCLAESSAVMTTTDKGEVSVPVFQDLRYCSNPTVYEGQPGSVEGHN